MANPKISEGTAHKLPADLRQALLASPKAIQAWEKITPLARNEWICWTISVKTDQTRQKHIERTVSELAEGIKRPCCWIGCIHRTDKAMSKSQKFLTAKKSLK